MAMTALAKSSAWGGGAVVVKLVLDALGRQLKDSGGWFLRYVVRGVLGGANLVAGWTSAFQMTVVLNGVVPTVGAGVSAGFALVYWVVLHVVGRKLFFAQSLPPAVGTLADKQRQAKEAEEAAESPSSKLEKLSADLKIISGRQIEFADLRQAAFCADWSDEEVKLALEKATRANETDGDEVNAVLKELEACTDVAARQLRLSTFDKAEKEKRELQNEEAELEKTISSLDESQDGAEIAALKAQEAGLNAKIEELNRQEEKSTIDLVFDEIDVDNSGDLTSTEFSEWWLKNGGDENRLETVQQAFQIIATRDGNTTVSIEEFRELIVASIQEDWEEKIDEETNKPYYVHVTTGESSWQDADERHAEQFFVHSGITKFTAVAD